MFNPVHIDTIGHAFYQFDQDCRRELANKRIVDEEDYVSNLTREWRRHPPPTNEIRTGHAQRLPNEEEQRVGADAIIIFSNGQQAKVGIFEAKRPKFFVDSSNSWDYRQESSGISHFTSQLRRQARWIPGPLVWEMFLHDAPPGASESPFDPLGSTCLEHRPVFIFAQDNNLDENLWNNAYLKTLVEDPPTGESPKHVGEMVEKILSCQYGPPLDIDDDQAILPPGSGSGDDEPLRIPIPETLPTTGEGATLHDNRYQDFLAQTKLTNYLIIEAVEETEDSEQRRRPIEELLPKPDFSEPASSKSYTDEDQDHSRERQRA